MIVTLTLPWPPSVNVMWRNPRSGPLAGRTLLSREGRAYRQAVAEQVMVQHAPRHALKGKLGVSIAVFPPDRRARDIDNLLKGILDSMQHTGVIRNDSDIDEIFIYRKAIEAPRGRIVVAVRELLDDPTQLEAA